MVCPSSAGNETESGHGFFNRRSNSRFKSAGVDVAPGDSYPVFRPAGKDRLRLAPGACHPATDSPAFQCSLT